jgi:hypothetical protein
MVRCRKIGSRTRWPPDERLATGDLSRVFDFSALQILPLVPGLCANRATTAFAQRRIRAAFAAIAGRASRLRILVVRQSLPGKPNSRWASETHNEKGLPQDETAGDISAKAFGKVALLQAGQ